MKYVPVATNMAAVFLALECGHAEDPSRGESHAPLSTPVMAEGYAMRPADYRNLTPHGLLADRMKLSLQKLIRDQALHTAYAEWGADQIARWIGAVAVLATVTDEDVAAMLNPKVEELRAAQDDQGIYYGRHLSDDPSQANTFCVGFGQGRALWNLAEYHRLTGDECILASLLRAADGTVHMRSVIQETRPYWGNPHTRQDIRCGIESGVGAMVALGQAHDRSEYLDYARYIADGMPDRVGAPSDFARVNATPAQLAEFRGVKNDHHTHSYLSIAHGVLDLAIVTGERRYLDQAARVFDDTLPSVWINGDIPEAYGEVFEHRDETCSTVDWIMLCLKLFDATGEARYLDAAELSIMNHLLFGQDAQGGFTCDRSVDRRHWMSSDNHGYVHQLCCSMHGGLALAFAAAHTVTQNDQGINVNLPLDVETKLNPNGNAVRVVQRVRLTPDALVQEVQVHNDGDAPIVVDLRLPYWCDAPRLRSDDEALPIESDSRVAQVQCAAHAHMTLELELPMRLVEIPARKNPLILSNPAVAGSATETGLQYGPFVLMLFREMTPQITERDLTVTIQQASDGRPMVTGQLPESWRAAGAVPLFLEARIGDGSKVMLTPCANTTMMPFTVADPYVLRFSRVELR